MPCSWATANIRQVENNLFFLLCLSLNKKWKFNSTGTSRQKQNIRSSGCDSSWDWKSDLLDWEFLFWNCMCTLSNRAFTSPVGGRQICAIDLWCAAGGCASKTGTVLMPCSSTNDQKRSQYSNFWLLYLPLCDYCGFKESRVELDLFQLDESQNVHSSAFEHWT